MQGRIARKLFLILAVAVAATNIQAQEARADPEIADFEAVCVSGQWYAIGYVTDAYLFYTTVQFTGVTYDQIIVTDIDGFFSHPIYPPAGSSIIEAFATDCDYDFNCTDGPTVSDYIVRN